MNDACFRLIGCKSWAPPFEYLRLGIRSDAAHTHQSTKATIVRIYIKRATYLFIQMSGSSGKKIERFLVDQSTQTNQPMGVCSSNTASADAVAIASLQDRLQDVTWKNSKPFIPEFAEGKIIKCYDGDTVTIATVLNDEVYRFNVRMLGYDCAEIRSKDVQEKQVAKWAKGFITDQILGQMVRVVKNEGYDKYGRLLLELEFEGRNINDIMKHKWGVSYHGGHKETVDWSKWGESGRVA